MTVPFPKFYQVTPVRPAMRPYAAYGKRLSDITLVVIAAPVVVPILFIIALAVWVQGGNPFYSQRRIGLGGREFRCWKIRTMVRDADTVLTNMIATDPEVAEEWALNQKLNNDPRITRLGRFLRRSSMDELPQLFNVLSGTMSLVGPRPFTPDQQALYADGKRNAAYYTLRPGISGLWQVSRRNAGTFGERVAYDEDYSLQMGLKLDLWILWRTCVVVLRATGV